MSQQIPDSAQSGCHAYNPDWTTSYGYVPSEAAGIVFCTIFALSMLLHIIQFSWKRIWWCGLFSIGALVELIGWAGRVWASKCPYNSTAFTIQISLLVVAPVFFTGGIYVLLGRLIGLFGRETSMLSAKQYLWIFCSSDVLSLIIQAAGGGIASSEPNKGKDTSPGTHIMIGGIIIQLVSILTFIFFAINFHLRVRRLGYGSIIMRSYLKHLVMAMWISIIAVLIRSIYRVVELSQGWTGYVITHEVYFIVLDAVMMVIAVGIFNIFHPGWLLIPSASVASAKEKSPMGMQESGSSSSNATMESTAYNGHHASVRLQRNVCGCTCDGYELEDWMVKGVALGLFAMARVAWELCKWAFIFNLMIEVLLGVVFVELDENGDFIEAISLYYETNWFNARSLSSNPNLQNP